MAKKEVKGKRFSPTQSQLNRLNRMKLVRDEKGRFAKGNRGPGRASGSADTAAMVIEAMRIRAAKEGYQDVPSWLAGLDRRYLIPLVLKTVRTEHIFDANIQHSFELQLRNLLKASADGQEQLTAEELAALPAPDPKLQVNKASTAIIDAEEVLVAQGSAPVEQHTKAQKA